MMRLPNFFRTRKLGRELADEMAGHFEEKIEEFVESGMTREEAVFAARRSFGNATLLLEQGQDV